MLKHNLVSTHLAKMKYPRFLKNSPKGEDLFEGKSHEKIAETLFDLIRKKAIPNNVIGLEGKWGSGKSNIIKILEKKFEDEKQDYVFYTYDAWAHQEDLTRKTFLDGLISHLNLKVKFKKGYDVEDLKKRVFSKVTKTKVETQPKVKLYYIYILIAVFTFTLCNSLYDDFISDWDIIPEYENLNLKKFVCRYLAAGIFFALAIWDFIVEVIALNRKNTTKNIPKREKLKRLLYVFSGTDVESENFSETYDEQPSIKDFKAYFREILESVSAKGLVIVFDNMDRLISKEKVLSIWSSIHTFFAEENLQNAWVVVPYDKLHLSSYFETNGNGKAHETLDNFIGKTFTTAFRVSPPVLSDWKRFFDDKFKEAFGPEISKQYSESTSSLYELINPASLRKPRDIIGFINNMVALKLQHADVVSIEYIALFCLRKLKILDNPSIEISSKHFMEEERHLFQEDKELEENMAVLVYNIDKEKCSEVLLRNSIQDALRGFVPDTLDALQQHSEFGFYFNEAMINSGLGNYYPENISKNLDYLAEVIPEQKLKTYWEKFANSLEKRVKEDFLAIKDWHKLIMTNTGIKTSTKFGNKLIETSKNEINKDSGTKQYYKNLYEIVEFQKKRRIKSKIDRVVFSPSQMLDFINDYSEEFDKEKCDFHEMNIHTDSKELDNYIVNHEDEMEEVAHEYKESITFLLKTDKKYHFKNLKAKISEILKTIAYTAGSERILNLIEIEKALCNKKAIITLLPEATGNSYLNSYFGTYEDLDKEIFANQIAHLPEVDARNTQLINQLKEEKDDLGLASIIQYYLRYGNLLKTYVKHDRSYPLIAILIKEITTNKFGFTQSLDVEWAFRNLNKICENLFSSEYDVFLRKLDEWSPHFEEHITEEIIFDIIDEDVLDILIEYWDVQLECIEHIVKKIERRLTQFDKSAWEAILKSETIEFRTISKFLENEKLSSKITKSSSFMDAYDEVLKDIANRTVDVPEDTATWNFFLIKEMVDGRQLKRIFNGVLDIFLVLPETTPNEIAFLAEGFFSYASNRLKRTISDEFIRKIILPLKDDIVQFDYVIENYQEEIAEIVKICNGEYNLNLASMLTKMLNSTMSSKDAVNYIFRHTTLNPVLEEELHEKSEVKKDENG